MAVDRLKTRLWIQALVRRCDQESISIFVRRKGDADAGAVVLLVDRREGPVKAYTQTRTLDDELAWTERDLEPGPGLAEFIERQVSFDPDLWIIDIEDPDHRYQIDGIVV